MNEKIKQQLIARLHEDRFTREVCPGVRTEDWILAYLFERPDELDSDLGVLKPEYISTTSGQALCRRLHQLRNGGYSPRLDGLAFFYGTQAEEHPERAEELSCILAHVARLKDIANQSEPVDPQTALDIVHGWCEDRRKALDPNRKRPTDELEGELLSLQQELGLIRQKMEELDERKETLRGEAYDLESWLGELLEELRFRPDRHVDLDEAGKTRLARVDRDPRRLRQRLIQYVRNI